MSIPRRIIQTGKSQKLEGLAKAASVNLKLLHHDWEIRFFDDAAVTRFVVTEFPEYEANFEAFAQNIQRFDFFRYLAVYRLGGFYFDLDVLLSEKLDALTDEQAVFPFEELTLNRFLRTRYGMDWEIGNYAFGAAAGDPFLRAVIDNCLRAQRDPKWLREMSNGIPALFQSEFHVFNTTGPGLLTRTLVERPELAKQVRVLFPDNVCNPEAWHQFGSYGLHLMDGSWRGRRGFVRQKLARLWEVRSRARLLLESVKQGPQRSVSFTSDGTEALALPKG